MRKAAAGRLIPTGHIITTTLTVTKITIRQLTTPSRKIKAAIEHSKMLPNDGRAQMDVETQYKYEQDSIEQFLEEKTEGEPSKLRFHNCSVPREILPPEQRIRVHASKIQSEIS
jgi:hypothetical protein